MLVLQGAGRMVLQKRPPALLRQLLLLSQPDVLRCTILYLSLALSEALSVLVPALLLLLPAVLLLQQAHASASAGGLGILDCCTDTSLGTACVRGLSLDDPIKYGIPA